MTTASKKRPGGLARTLFWSLTGLGLLLASAMYWAGRTRISDRSLAGLSVFCIGSGLVMLAWSNLQRGSIRGRSRPIYREERPGTYWTALVLQLLAGVAAAASGLLVLLGLLG